MHCGWSWCTMHAASYTMHHEQASWTMHLAWCIIDHCVDAACIAMSSAWSILYPGWYSMQDALCITCMKWRWLHHAPCITHHPWCIMQDRHPCDTACILHHAWPCCVIGFRSLLSHHANDDQNRAPKRGLIIQHIRCVTYWLEARIKDYLHPTKCETDSSTTQKLLATMNYDTPSIHTANTIW